MKKLNFDLILLGDPTSGKDTQGRLLNKIYKSRLAQSGVYLRNLIRKKKAAADLVKSYNRGLPVPSKYIDQFLKDSLLKAGSRSVIFVGTPKLKREAEFLVKNFKKQGRDFFVIYIKLPLKLILKRSHLRNRENLDIKRNLLKNRINYHKKEVGETVNYFRSLNKIRFVQGNKPIAKVTKELVKIINDYQKFQGN